VVNSTIFGFLTDQLFQSYSRLGEYWGINTMGFCHSYQPTKSIKALTLTTASHIFMMKKYD